MRPSIVTLFLILVELIHFQMCFNNQHFNRNETDGLEINAIKILERLLGEYSLNSFHIVFYYDEKCLHVLKTLMNLMNKTTGYTTTLYNYDARENNTLILRPISSQIVHLILSLNFSFWTILAGADLVIYRDVILFVSFEMDVKFLLKQNKKVLKLSGKTLLLETVNGTPTLYKTCFYCGELQNKFAVINTNSIETTEEIFPDNFRNLQGHLLNLVFIPNYPFISCANHHSRIYANRSSLMCTHIEGIESHMVHLISKKMNFVYLLHELEANAPYYEMLRTMKEYEMDLAFGSISMTLKRRVLIEFTTQYNVESFSLLYLSGTTFADMCEKFFDPFSSSLLWALFLLSYFALAILLFVIQKAETRDCSQKTLKDCHWVCNSGRVKIGSMFSPFYIIT